MVKVYRHQIPILFDKKDLLDFDNATTDNGLDIKPQGTISEYWLGCPLIVGDKTIGAIVVQSYDKNHEISIEDRDLLSFVSELLAIVIENKHLEDEQMAYQSNLEKKIDDRTKELFYAKEKAENVVNDPKRPIIKKYLKKISEIPLLFK